MILNAIHKKDRTDRYESLQAEQLRQKEMQAIVFHEAVTDLPKKHQSIGASHKKVVQFAYDKGLPFVVVGEDDLHFPAQDGWRYFINSIPKHDFLLHLGGAYTYKLTIDKYGFHPVLLHKWSGMHLYVVHQRFYKDFLDADTTRFNIEEAIRVKLSERNANASVCFPFAAVQAETPSDNVKGKIYKINDFLTDITVMVYDIR